MRRVFAGVLVLLSISLSAQTADEIIAKYIETVGGIDRIRATHTIRRTGRFNGGGGFEAVYAEENKRPNLVRQDFTFQGMTGITAYDGSKGWKIEPWSGKKDPEPLSEDELKGIIDDADFDGPLVDSAKKGNKVEYVGTEPVEGTDAYKLKVTLANGDVRYYYMDTDYYVPIKIDTKRTVRGAEREYETILGDYKEAGGWYQPHSIATGVKGNPNRGTITFDKIETNVAIANARFVKPGDPVPADTPLHRTNPSKSIPKRSPASARGTSARPSCRAALRRSTR
ncbi:MAG: LolA family protein [Thermoanaerobaculia bacterium]